MNDDGALDHAASAQASGRRRKMLISAVVAVAAAVAAYFALGMPGMDHGTGRSMSAVDSAAPSNQHQLLDPDAFADAIDDPAALLINVHVPYDGEIEATDLFVPFDALDPGALPTDRTTRLLIYCRTGRMSAIAASTLLDLGYSNVAELDGGMQAWQRSGRQLARTPPSSG